MSLVRVTQRACLIAAAIVSVAAASAAAKPAQPRSYDVPKTIRSDCSVAVEAKLMAWLAGIPDGSTVRFARSGCYRQDDTITLTGRNRLLLDGRGSEFRALSAGASHRANWRFVDGSGLTVENMAVRGNDPQGAYDPNVQWQHGFSIEGVQGMTLTNVQVRETWGDGVYVGRSTASPACGDDASSARNVVVSHATLERIGRQGLAVVDGEQVTLQDSTVGPVAWLGVDVEPDDTCDIARHITVTRNSFGANRYGVVGSFGFGGDPQVGDLTVTDNVQTAPTGLPAAGECYSAIPILSPDGLYRSHYTFTGNKLLARRYAFNFQRLRDVQVSGNTVTWDSSWGCSTSTGVNLTDSHTIAITNNVLSGAASVYQADGLSTDITAQGNTGTTPAATSVRRLSPAAPICDETTLVGALARGTYVQGSCGDGASG